MIITDAHKYLLEHYKEFDFIWSSPPCPSHSRARFWASFGENKTKIYPNMTLYQEIIFLQHYAKDIKFIIENVKPYYNPLIDAQECGRHLFWSNFHIPKRDFPTKFTTAQSFTSLQKTYNIDLSKYKLPFGKDNRVVVRNMIDPELGQYILNCAMNIITQENVNQIKLKL